MKVLGLLALFASVDSFSVPGTHEMSGELCRPTERFLSCGGCQATCKDPAPQCAAVCRTGCYCRHGQVRNETGHCVDLSECPGVGTHEMSGELCRPTERFLSCGGCQATCKDPAPQCAAVCRTGCYCRHGQVRNETGHCVDLSECPGVAPAKQELSEPRHTESWCPPDEEYRLCEACNKTCENPNPVCLAQCTKGCFCKDDLVRNKDGVCVKVENCTSSKNLSSNLVKPVALQLTCGPHQTYSHCKSCERVCSSAEPVCRSPCSAGCFCDDGYLKAPSGQCVNLEQCPKAEESLGGAQEPTVEDCSSDEIFLVCGWCEPTCREPNPVCPHGVCQRGCLCRPPLLRDHNGHCVPRRECTPQKVCSDPNEEFVCRYGWCEARCDSYKCDARPRRCLLGCYCRLGLFRNSEGKCVSLLECPEYNVTNPRSDNDSDINIFVSHNNDDTVITFNISDSSEEKLFDDVPHIYLGVPNIRTLTLSDVENENAPKSVFDLPMPFDISYSNNNQVFKKAIADTTRKPSYREMDVGNNVVHLSRDRDFEDLTISNEQKRPRTILSMLKAGQFIVHKEPTKPKLATMNDFIMKTLSEVIPQGVPVNLTIVNYNPMWSPITPVGH